MFKRERICLNVDYVDINYMVGWRKKDLKHGKNAQRCRKTFPKVTSAARDIDRPACIKCVAV